MRRLEDLVNHIFCLLAKLELGVLELIIELFVEASVPISVDAHLLLLGHGCPHRASRFLSVLSLARSTSLNVKVVLGCHGDSERVR